MSIARWPAAVLVVALVSACSTGTADGTRAPEHPITVLAASSLKAGMTAAGEAYTRSHPKSPVTLGFDASSALLTKIEQGAPADIFASADFATATRLVADGFAIGPAQAFAGNRLAIVVPKSNPAHVATPADLARSGVRLVAAGEGVPISSYASQLIGLLAHESGYPAGFAARVASNVASREDNVAAVAAKVALGEGDAGIVYETDALASPNLVEIPLPAGVSVSVTYAAVVIKGSPETDAARAFVTWLAGPSGQSVLARFGFLAPP